MNSKKRYSFVAVMLVATVMVSLLGACGDSSANANSRQNDANAIPLAQVTATSAPDTIGPPGPSGSPTATPTEIPVILPTPTEVGANRSPVPPTNLLLPTSTPTPIPPTNTPAPTATFPPAPTPTPVLPVRVAAVYEYPFDRYNDSGYSINPVVLTNACVGNGIIPVPGIQGEDSGNPGDSDQGGGFLTQGVVTGSWINYTIQNYVRSATLVYVQSVAVISDTAQITLRINDLKPDVVMVWNVMNSVNMQLIDIDTDPAVYQRAYEAALNKILGDITKTNPHTRVMLGNVPDLNSLRYYRPCFNPERLASTQSAFNRIINSAASRYPNRVYIADMTQINLKDSPLYISRDNGFFLTRAGYREAANIFGKIYARLGITRPEIPASIFNQPTATPRGGGGGGGGTDTGTGGGGATGGGSGGGATGGNGGNVGRDRPGITATAVPTSPGSGPIIIIITGATPTPGR